MLNKAYTLPRSDVNKPRLHDGRTTSDSVRPATNLLVFPHFFCCENPGKVNSELERRAAGDCVTRMYACRRRTCHNRLQIDRPAAAASAQRPDFAAGGKSWKKSTTVHAVTTKFLQSENFFESYSTNDISIRKINRANCSHTLCRA